MVETSIPMCYEALSSEEVLRKWPNKLLFEGLFGIQTCIATI